MVNKEWMHRLHGDDLHDILIFLAERYLVRHGGKYGVKLKATKVFKDRGLPCEPDVFFEMTAKIPHGAKKSTVKQFYVIEVETNPTPKSILTKYHQYKDTYAGLTDLIILGLDELDAYAIMYKRKPEEAIYDWRILTEWISAKMPFGRIDGRE